ncbi:hypothetical protein JQC67_06660 [Aurantibacter crassamenti]|uniref:glucosamine inositolphosphorylceramide transferase family protein n=1 Tax=Aurantibacter crassamenti TaxID=1837375 RepID=UPI0019399A16|nr:hypothetical protein [Aurantibacter crassamenti]MBM1105810.1 hypothetical protein [Aurantibacter crassamenti]
MKIAVITDDLNNLANWQMRILQHLLVSKELELSALITVQKTTCEHYHELKTPKNNLAKFFLKLQWSLERKFFFKKLKTIKASQLSERLSQVNKFEINENSTSNSKDIEQLKLHNLDLILKLEDTIHCKELSGLAKHGTWSLKHNAKHITNHSPTGFWEIMNKEATVVVSLLKVSKTEAQPLLLDQAHFNKHWSLVKTTDMVLESSVALLTKNLKSVATLEPTEQASTKTQTILAQPNALQIVDYMLKFYTKVTTKILERLASKILNWRYQCFTLFIAKGQFNTTDLSTLEPIKLPKDEFWADPFLFDYKNETYVFFENYPYSTKRGKISCGRLKNNQIVDVIDILDFDYHLSYPYVFEENGEIYLMPESSENKKLEIYKCTHFPDQWELHSTAFEGELIADAFFFDDENNEKWLFLNKAATTTVPLENELYIYKVSSTDLLKKLIPHKQNPVLIDSRTARNGGAIFSYKNKIYRPSQANDQGVYGRALNINRITNLTLEEYSEETIETVEPDFYEGLMSVHHLHQTDDRFVIDAAYKRH